MSVSFRTRLFVISGLIVGSVLSAVLLVGYSRVLAFEMVRLDERLCMEARRLATQRFRPDSTERLQFDVMSKLRISEPAQLMFKFESRAPSGNGSGDVSDSFQSREWKNPPPLDPKKWDALADRRPAPSGIDRREAMDPPSPDGDEVAQKPLSGGMGCALASFKTLGKLWRAARYTADGGSSMLAVGLQAANSELQAAFGQALKLVVPLAILLTALGAWLLSALTMRPVTRLSRAMANTTPKALDARMPSRGEDREFAALIDAYNAMLARLEASFQQASRFSSDAAHELKTPLTILQGTIEQALVEATQPALQVRLVGLLDEVARLSDITRKLLLLSQADAGYLALQRVPVDVSKMLDEMAADMQMLITTQSLKHNIARDLVVMVDAVLLRQLLNNLISNAVRHGLPDGWIRLSALTKGGVVDIEVSNSTQPIDAHCRTQFFDRFFRGDLAHSRGVEGSGLGLSLASEIALAHGGDLVLLNTATDVVSLRLTLLTQHATSKFNKA